MKILRYTNTETQNVTLQLRATVTWQVDRLANQDERVLQHVKHRLLHQLQTLVGDLDLDDLEIEDV